MKKIHKNYLTGLAVSVSAMAMFAAAPAYAQDADEVCELDQAGNPDEDCGQDERPSGVISTVPGENDPVSVNDFGADGSIEQGAIVVTGSRIRRDTFSSISPLQILESETQRDVGEFDAAQILQRSESAAGTQIDATFQGFVLNNGPGSQTLDLRGLGSDRTLLLINGRRIAPAGVEGAPSSPSINLLPSSLIARYDLLLDGASSVYGSDAVAGVGNIILRNDIDGIELFASGNVSEQGGPADYTLSAAYGKQFDRGFVGIGGEYARRGGFRLGDRDFLAGCDTDYEITQGGEIRTLNVAENANVLNDSGGTVTTPNGSCKLDRIIGRISIAGTRVGSVYYDDRTYPTTNVPGNTGIPFFSETTDAFGQPVDRDGDGVRDIDLFQRTANGFQQNVNFISPEDRYNVLAYGEYRITDDDYGITPFFEALYSRADVNVDQSSIGQFFQYVPGYNQTNPCNLTTGLDCRNADNVFNGLIPGSPFFGARLPVGTSQSVQPIVSIRGDRNNVETSLEQYRGVLGVRGDLPFINDTWSFELAGTYSRSEGSSIRRGIRADKTALALGVDPTADFDGDGIVDNDGDGIADDFISQVTQPRLAGGPCDLSSLANPGLAAPDLGVGCVPVNFFAPSLFPAGQAFGDLATQAERDAIFGERTFDTSYEQIIVSGFVTGDVFELPAGPVGVVLGGEYRRDEINSMPNFVASNGLFFGFFSDGGAVGDKYIVEAFGEVNVPVFDSDYFGQFEVNLSGRISDEEFYGTNETYSIKAGWRPVPAVLLKASYGTSFRAPNLRENFLRAQSGFVNVFDPCAVPSDAFDSLGGGYNAANDTRDPAILDNCRREGRDPTTVGLAPGQPTPFQTSSVESTSGGSLELDPETSKSFTTGVGISESFGGFDFAFNFNYYSIVIDDSVVEPGAQFIVNDCFTRTDGLRSPFCDRITPDMTAGGDGLISDVFAGFINLNKEKVRGLDINANFGYDLPVGGDIFSLGLNLRANHLIERSTLFIDAAGNEIADNFEGEFGFPSWTGRAIGTIGFNDLTFTWQTRYIGKTEQNADGIDPFSDAFGYGPDGEFTGVFTQTCLGAGSRDDDGTLNGIVAGDGTYCRNVGFADAYFVHTASLRYEYNDDISLRFGVSNVFDEAPPLIDTAEVLGISNTPIGNGYDLNGRQYFGSVSVRF